MIPQSLQAILASQARQSSDGRRGPSANASSVLAIDSPSGSTARYLERLKDAVTRTPGGRYQLPDPVFGLWLTWRRPGGTVVPMRVVGDEAELAVAEHLPGWAST